MFGRSFSYVLAVVVLVSSMVLSACAPKPAVTPVPAANQVVGSASSPVKLIWPSGRTKTLVIGMVNITPSSNEWTFAHMAALERVIGEVGEVKREGDQFAVMAGGELRIRTVAWLPSNDYSSEKAIGAAESMIRDEGAGVIFVTAEDWCKYLTSTRAASYPNVGFACIRCEPQKNVVSMYPKSWAGHCAACAAAAAVVDEPKLGLLGAYGDNPQVQSNHGACAACFTQAWRELHPGDRQPIEIFTNYIGSWGDKGNEHMAALTLQSQGAAVIDVHLDSSETALALAEEADWEKKQWSWAIGYDSDWSRFTGPPANRLVLTSVTIDWSDIYRKTIQMVLDGDFQGFRWNPGLAEGAVRLADFSPDAPQKAKEVAENYAAKLASGWRPCGDDEFMWSLTNWRHCYEKAK